MGKYKYSSLNWLLLLAILLPSVFVVSIILASYIPHKSGFLTHEQEHLLLAMIIVVGIVTFSFLIFRLFHRIQAHIVRQNQELSRGNREMEALLKVGRAVEESLDLDIILPAALEAVLEATSAEAAESWLIEPEENTLLLRYHRGAARESFLSLTRMAIGEGYPGIVAQTGQPIIIHDLPKDTRFLRPQIQLAGFQTFYALPLSRQGRTIGVLAVAARDPEALTNEAELRLLELMADHIAAAVENARLHEEVRTLAIITERERLAREMHDGLAQVLGYVNTKAQAVKELLKGGQLESAVQQMEQLESAAQETYDDVREAILALGSNGSKQPLLDSLGEYVRRYSEIFGLPAYLEVKGIVYPLNPGTEVQILRIVQEALANSRKHAQASSVHVTLTFSQSGCKVEVEDNGRGFDPVHLARGPWPHLGLKSMQERATAVGANFTLDTAPGKGTRVVLDLHRGAM